MKKIFSVILCISILFSINYPVLAKDSGLLITFKTGSSIASFNQRTQSIEKPFLKNGIVFVPLKAWIEAYGGEVRRTNQNKVDVEYRDMSVSFTLGSKSYKVNEVLKAFSSLPIWKGKKDIMVPVDFITLNFGGTLRFNSKTKAYSLLLSDDGAITDFSAVIGSINKARVGNSYFGWSIAIPKGSQMIENTFNSKTVTIGNDQRGIGLSVDVEVDEGKSLEDYLKEMKESSESNDYSEDSIKILDSSIHSTASEKYAEILSSDSFRGGIIRRIYLGKGYVYKVTVSSSKELNPQKMKKDFSIVSLIQSFKLGYMGNVQDTKDLSKVKDGIVKYTDTMYGFTLQVPPEWEVLDNNYNGESQTVKIGLNKQEYIQMYPEYIEGVTDIETFGNTVKSAYNEEMNSKLFQFLELKPIELSQTPSSQLIYKKEINKKKYIFEETLFPQGDLIYHIVMRIPEVKYLKGMEPYDKIFNSIQYSEKNYDQIKKNLESSKTNALMNRVGKTEEFTEYTSKEIHWKMKLPGTWMTIPYFNDNIKLFSDDSGQSFLGIETVENNLDTLKQDDKTVFDTLKSIQDGRDDYRFINKEIIKEKGQEITIHRYRLEDDKTETYGDAIHYVVHGEKYSYCFFYILQDIYTSEKNINVLNEIWASFNF